MLVRKVAGALARANKTPAFGEDLMRRGALTTRVNQSAPTLGAIAGGAGSLLSQPQ